MKRQGRGTRPACAAAPLARGGALLLAGVLAGCVAQTGASNGPPSDFIVVSDFVVPEGAVRLDPSFGFSLYRGEPGVPARQRAHSIGRSVAFLVTDTVTERLRAQGYGAVSALNANAPTGYRALLVNGTFREIDEGHRRQVGHEQSEVVATVEIRAELPNGTLQPLQSFTVDSRTAPPARPSAGTTRRETGVDADAARVGAEIARLVAETARRNNWLPAAR